MTHAGTATAEAFLPDFSYGSGHAGPSAMPIALSIYADRAHLRATLREDAAAAGLRVTTAAGLDVLFMSEARPLGDVVMVDCPLVDMETLAALVRLDLRAERTGARLIVSTSPAALDDVFACMDRSAPQFLVDPTRADRLIALGHVLARMPGGQVRELSEDDRMMILRLTEQVGQIAGRIDKFAPQPLIGRDEPQIAPASAFPFADMAPRAPGFPQSGTRAAKPPLPEARLVRRIIKQRQQRARFFEGELFSDPAWDMLLDLTAARAEHVRVSVTSLCIAANVPPTTALRWIGQMVEAGLFVRSCDDTDRRRAFIDLSDRSAEAMASYFAEAGLSATHAV